MGRSGWRTEAESTRRIDLAWLKELGLISTNGIRNGHLSWTSGGERSGDIRIRVDTFTTVPTIRFMYRSRDWWETGDDAWVDRDYRFNLEKIPCRYGGCKWFIRCGLSKNGVYCGRRVRVLYSIGGWYGCRHCGNITYARCNYGGRHKGFLSIPDLDKQEEKVKRTHYAGKPTRKYRRLLKMERQFDVGFINTALWFQNRSK